MKAPNMCTLTPRELVCPRTKGEGSARGTGAVGDAASLLVLRKRGAAISKMGEKNIRGEKEVMSRPLADANTAF